MARGDDQVFAGKGGALKKILKGVKSNGNYVFSKNGERFNPTYASRAFKKCVRILGLDDKIHFHTLPDVF